MQTRSAWSSDRGRSAGAPSSATPSRDLTTASSWFPARFSRRCRESRERSACWSKSSLSSDCSHCRHLLFNYHQSEGPLTAALQRRGPAVTMRCAHHHAVAVIEKKKFAPRVIEKWNED